MRREIWKRLLWMVVLWGGSVLAPGRRRNVLSSANDSRRFYVLNTWPGSLIAYPATISHTTYRTY